MLSDLLATVKVFFPLAIENRFECPEVFVTHHSAEVPFRSEHGRGCPSFCHRFVSPSANTPGPATHSECGFSITGSYPKSVISARRAAVGVRSSDRLPQ